MKLTAPNNPEDYFEKTEHAVRHHYAGLNSCWDYYQKALGHWDISKVGQPLTKENKKDLDKYLELASKHFYLKFSEAMFAGGILQIAFMAIKLYSGNESIPRNCEPLLRKEDKENEYNKPAIKFCIGREYYGIPSGLIIYAGRNQFNHWEVEPRTVSRNVFYFLSKAFQDGMWADLAFEASNPTINVYASEILLTALRWAKYETYIEEMKAMLI